MNLFLDIDTVAYLTEFMMSVSKYKLKVEDITYDADENFFKKSDAIPLPSSKIIYTENDVNKRVIIVTDNSYYSVFCEERNANNEWELKYWDAEGAYNPYHDDISQCLLDDNYKEKLTPDKRLVNTSNNKGFIVHDGTCGVGAAKLCKIFLSGENVHELTQINHIEYTENFVRKNSTHQNPRPDPQKPEAQALCWQKYAQKIN